MNTDLNTHDNTQTNDEPHVHAPATRSGRPALRGRRTIRIVAMLMVVLTATMGAVAQSGSPAQAATTVSRANCRRPGSINTTVGVSANRLVQNGGQYVSVRYYLKGAAGGTYDSGYTKPFLAPYGGTQVTSKAFSVNWGWTSVFINVAYWTGSRWVYESGWTRIDNGVCLA